MRDVLAHDDVEFVRWPGQLGRFADYYVGCRSESALSRSSQRRRQLQSRGASSPCGEHLEK
jgi:hypothetical protein